MFMIQLEPHEMTPDYARSKLEVVKKFMSTDATNKFKTPIFFPEGWDETPPAPAPLRKLDHVLQYSEILRLLRMMFPLLNGRWYAANQEAANAFFTAGHIPFAAHADLGFPVEQVLLDTTPTYHLN